MNNTVTDIRNRLNHCSSLLITANRTDLSGLAALHEELSLIEKNEGCPTDMQKWAQRAAALSQSIILGDTAFETGITRLSSAISDALSTIDETLKRGEASVAAVGGMPGVANDSVAFGDEELRDMRTQFAKNQSDALNKFEAVVLEMEKGTAGSKDEICRILHTWKGEFGILDLPEYSHALHSIEDAVKNNTITASDLLGFKDALQKRIEYACDSGEFPSPPDMTWRNNSGDETSTATGPLSRAKIDIGHIDDTSLLAEFINEATDLIHNAETALLDLETSPENADAVHTVFRACHTIKGSAGFLRLPHVQTLAHAMEDVLANVRDKTMRLSEQIIDILLHSMDILKEIIYAINKSMSGEEQFIPECFDEVVAELKKGHFYPEQWCTNERPAQGMPIGEVLVQRGVVGKSTVADALQKQQVGDQRKIGQILIEDAGIKARDVGKALAAQKNSRPGPAGDNTIRIPVEKLDALIDSIGEAVIAQAMLIDDPAVRGVKSHEYQKKASRLSIIMRRIQEQSMSLRMVSIKPTFQKMARIVRDLAHKNGKSITFVTEGEDTELDKTVIENIGDPLMHMVRNAVDHGIETVEERHAAGKSESGTLILRAYHRGGGVFIEIEDDGRGLDRDAILKKAIEKGLCRKDARLSDQEIFQFIFAAGLSTAQKVTDISGRGVGMDVVRKNITHLRGSIDIQSAPGKGAKFIIRLPLTLAIIDGLVVRAGGSRFIVPLLSVVECVAISTENMHGLMHAHVMFKLRDTLLPVINLARVLDVGKSVGHALSTAGVVVEDPFGTRAVVAVDAIESRQQVVIKSLGNGFGAAEAVAGGAIMSDGCVSLILDVAAVIRMANAAIGRAG